MHPADEFEAFRALVDGGMSETDVAARFGVTETVVSRRYTVTFDSGPEDCFRVLGNSHKYIRFATGRL
jgi:hypothetical protein